MTSVQDPQHAKAISEIADRLFAAVSAVDIDALAEIYDADIEVHHHFFDNDQQTGAENREALRQVPPGGLQYHDVRRNITDSGFVQQHTLQRTGPDGSVTHLPVCIVAETDGHTITRIDEYLDSGQVGVRR